MNSCALIELHYLPSIQYFTKFLLYDEIVIEKFENYTKGGFRNRCRIIQSNGFQELSIPLSKGKHEQQAIDQVMIHYSESWQRQHWQSIKTAYGSAPFWDYYSDPIRELIFEKSDLLFNHNLSILNWIIDTLNLEKNYSFSQEYLHKVDARTDDLRNTISPKFSIANDHLFKAQKYTQVFEDRLNFISNASIIDLIFCCGPESIEILEKSINN